MGIDLMKDLGFDPEDPAVISARRLAELEEQTFKEIHQVDARKTFTVAEVKQIVYPLINELRDTHEGRLTHRELIALQRVWRAADNAGNPDDFKTSVRDKMWDQLVEQLEKFAAGATRLHHENEELRSELAAVSDTALVDRERLAEMIAGYANEDDPGQMPNARRFVDHLLSAFVVSPAPADREKLKDRLAEWWADPRTSPRMNPAEFATAVLDVIAASPAPLAVDEAKIAEDERAAAEKAWAEGARAQWRWEHYEKRTVGKHPRNPYRLNEGVLNNGEHIDPERHDDEVERITSGAPARDEWEEKVRAAAVIHSRGETSYHPAQGMVTTEDDQIEDGCQSCQEPWPCATAAALGLPVTEEEEKSNG